MAKILLADDEEALRLLLGRQLRRAGHEVTLAEDGQRAAELLSEAEFDLVLSDMKMPRLDGMGLLARAAQIAPKTEFIILTGHGALENAVEAFKTGNVFDYLLKPLDDIFELNAVVDRAIERRTLRRENHRLVGELQARIDELEIARRELAEIADRDGLTGLLNHRAIHARLETTLASDSNACVSVLMFDMDSFKRLNDTYGHPVGDQVLRHLAEAMRYVAPPNAFLGRCGGDEFMAILPDCNAFQAEAAAARLRSRLVESPFRNPEGTPLPIQLCIGIADSDSVSRTAANLTAAADAALYEGKQQGGDAVTRHHASQSSTPRSEAGESIFSVLDGLVTAIDRKDRYTRKHSEHMTGYALQLAQALGCSEQTYNVVRTAGLLHDVGKIGVPDDILRKPGKLTEGEYEVMKKHVTLSALIIHNLPHLESILEAVACHHERWDGRGYPGGLSGETIPVLGRIMAIADAFSAMTLDRPYRAGMSLEAALAEIERGAGTQFDPKLAALFVATLHREMRENTLAALSKAA